MINPFQKFHSWMFTWWPELAVVRPLTVVATTCVLTAIASGLALTISGSNSFGAPDEIAASVGFVTGLLSVYWCFLQTRVGRLFPFYSGSRGGLNVWLYFATLVTLNLPPVCAGIVSDGIMDRKFPGFELARPESAAMFLAVLHTAGLTTHVARALSFAVVARAYLCALGVFLVCIFLGLSIQEYFLARGLILTLDQATFGSLIFSYIMVIVTGTILEMGRLRVGARGAAVIAIIAWPWMGLAFGVSLGNTFPYGSGWRNGLPLILGIITSLLAVPLYQPILNRLRAMRC